MGWNVCRECIDGQIKETCSRCHGAGRIFLGVGQVPGNPIARDESPCTCFLGKVSKRCWRNCEMRSFNTQNGQQLQIDVGDNVAIQATVSGLEVRASARY